MVIILHCVEPDLLHVILDMGLFFLVFLGGGGVKDTGYGMYEGIYSAIELFGI